jgi:hypothetical protein
MTRIILVLVVACISITEISSQSIVPKAARDLSQFETSWLMADLNNEGWSLNRFSSQKVNASGGESIVIRDRSEAVRMLLKTPLSPKEIKVRISGTVSFLTNDPDQNRSYYFLDTFNKIGGKWQIIASSISPSHERGMTGVKQIEEEVSTAENEWTRARKTNERGITEKMTAPEFIGTAATGAVTDRRGWLDSRNNEWLKSLTSSERQIRLITDTLAIATGIDTVVRIDNASKEMVEAERFTRTWTKRDGIWQCVAAHASRIN